MKGGEDGCTHTSDAPLGGHPAPWVEGAARVLGGGCDWTLGPLSLLRGEEGRIDQFWLLRSHCYYMYSINMESGQGLSLVVRITKSDSRHAFRDSAIFAGDMIPLKHYNIKRSNTHMMQKNAT